MIDHIKLADEIDEILARNIEPTAYTVCLVIKEVRYLRRTLHLLLKSYEISKKKSDLEEEFWMTERDVAILDQTIKNWSEIPNKPKILNDLIERLNIKFQDTIYLYQVIKDIMSELDK